MDRVRIANPYVVGSIPTRRFKHLKEIRMGISANVKQKDGKEIVTLELERRLCKVQVYSRKMFCEEVAQGRLVFEADIPVISENVKAVVITTYGDEKPSSNSIKFVTDNICMTMHSAAFYTVTD